MKTEDTLAEQFGEFSFKMLVKEIKDFAFFYLISEGLIIYWN